MIAKPVLTMLCLLVVTHIHGADIDSDKDGLSDFQEVHKYFTDPQKSDSDEDGIVDSDWHERREFTYSIRSVVKVMRPCNTQVVNDDYQDARVLAETSGYVELEVIHYPFNTNADGIEGGRQWRQQSEKFQEYLKPGITTNWDDTLQKDLASALAQDEIDTGKMTDKQVVESVSRWLLARGKYDYKFGTYFVHFPGGEAKLYPGLEDAFQREQGNTALPLQEHLQRELFGKGMFYNQSYGTCTSTAIYLTTGLRAVGVPTRMVLAIPVVDGSDPAQTRMIRDHISHNQVRATLLNGVPKSGFSAHTFNEVFVGGRWHRLNYSQLGQNVYGPGAMGMLTHVHTFNDLSEAGLTETWGWRYGRGEKDDLFRHANPYLTTEISDRFGIHSNLENPETRVVRITKAYWFLSDQRPRHIPETSVEKNGDGHILAHVETSFQELARVYPKLPTEFLLFSEGKPAIHARAERGYWNQECYLRIPANELAKMEPDIAYHLKATTGEAEYCWDVAPQVRLTKRE